jgi:hypothetical protein
MRPSSAELGVRQQSVFIEGIIMERKQILAEYTIVGTLSAAIVIATLNWINSVIPQLATLSSSAWLIRLLAATGTYLLFFKISIWFYFKILWKYLHKKTFLDGQWQYIYNDSYDPATETWDANADSSGIAQIEHTVEDIRIDGASHSQSSGTTSTSLISQWKTVATSLHGNSLDASIIIITGSGTANGIAILQVVTERFLHGILPVRPNKLKGHYYIIPSKNQSISHGRIEFRRI